MGIEDPKQLVCAVSTAGFHKLRVRSRRTNSVFDDKEGNKHHIVYCVLCFEHYDSIIKTSTDSKGKLIALREFIHLTADEVAKILKQPIQRQKKAVEPV